MRFSSRALKILTEAGWYHGRETDVSDAVRILTSVGYDIHPCAIEFLREFGGLSLQREGGKHKSEKIILHFGVEDWLLDHDYDDIHSDDERVHGTLTYIGLLESEGLEVQMRGDGKVFATWSGCLWEAGDSGDDLIARFCAGHRWKEIP